MKKNDKNFILNNLYIYLIFVVKVSFVMDIYKIIWKMLLFINIILIIEYLYILF